MTDKHQEPNKDPQKEAQKENESKSNSQNQEQTKQGTAQKQKPQSEETRACCIKKEAEILDLTTTLQRLQAEFENYRKRLEKENASFIKLANEGLIREILPIVDNFELALKNHKEKDEFYKGMELIYAQLIGALEDQGVRIIDCSCRKFDPYYHEALLAEESSLEPGTILEELQKGYILHDKVIRYSKVKIAKKQSNGASQAQCKDSQETQHHTTNHKKN